MIISIAQPAYLPWLGYFDRIHKSELAIVLDHVQFERRGFTHRNKVLGQHGPLWLTIPLNKKGNYNAPINEVTINNDRDWRKKHRETIRQCYGNAPFFKDYFPGLSEIYNKEWTSLSALLRESTDFLLQSLSIETKMIRSSDMGVKGVKSELILNLSKEVGATQYISGPFGREYLEKDRFENAGIKILYHDYHNPTYNQVQPGFVDNMSVIDLLFNYGNRSLEVLSCGQELSRT